MDKQNLIALARALPKAELHVHIEGTLEPELMLQLAARHGISLPYRDVAEVRQAYAFSNLQSFLDIYYAGASVLRTQDDFAQLTSAYLDRAAADGVVHAELFFDPQTHLARGIGFGTVIAGLQAGIEQAQQAHGITASLIMCFLRHLSEEQGFETLEAAMPYRRQIIGVGLDSSEAGHPPSKFARLFERCRGLGFRVVAHAGEEGPASYVWEALDVLKAERIDHGVRSVEDAALMQVLAERRVPLTVCPLSNVRLGVFAHMGMHNLPALLNAGLAVTINSDDPAYFGGYMQENWRSAIDHLPLTAGDLVQMARNSIDASFIDAGRKAALHARISAVHVPQG